VKVAVWEITAGVVTDVETDEVLIVLAGEGVVRFEGEHVELRPSAAVRAPAWGAH
jgi:mannose-6-phosphate isomerase-like protein (cupin superfamily)